MLQFSFCRKFRDNPIVLMNLNFGINAQINWAVVDTKFEVDKIIFNNMTLVNKTKNEIVESENRINFHNLLENWMRADFKHRFWSDVCYFPKPPLLLTAQNNNLHKSTEILIFDF